MRLQLITHWNVKYQNKSRCKIGDTGETAHLGRNGLSVIMPCRVLSSPQIMPCTEPPQLCRPVKGPRKLGDDTELWDLKKRFRFNTKHLLIPISKDWQAWKEAITRKPIQNCIGLQTCQYTSSHSLFSKCFILVRLLETTTKTKSPRKPLLRVAKDKISDQGYTSLPKADKVESGQMVR